VHWSFLHFPDGWPGFSHEQHSALKSAFVQLSHAVAGLTHTPLQDTSVSGSHPHEQVLCWKLVPDGHVVLTHWPPHSTVGAVHSHSQEAFRVLPPVHWVTHSLLPAGHSTVPPGHTHWQLELRILSPWHVTQLPPHSVPLVHSHWQVVKLRVCPSGHGPRHWPLHSTVGAVHSHSQEAFRVLPLGHWVTHSLLPAGHSTVPPGHTHWQLELRILSPWHVTQLPPHSVPLVHSHWQVVELRVCPVGHGPRHWAGLPHAVVPAGHSHWQVCVFSVAPPPQLIWRHWPPQATKPSLHSQR
jgi:hypothetical protein